MPVGNPRSFYKKFKFVVEIDGFAYFGFQKCSELTMEVGVVTHREDGTLLADKTPGVVTVPNITLERGATRNLEMYLWFKEVVDVTSEQGNIDGQYDRDIDIVQLDRDGTEIDRWNVTAAWPRMFSAGEWDNEAEEVVITKLELVIESFTPQSDST